jgi:hypothetical protein
MGATWLHPETTPAERVPFASVVAAADRRQLCQVFKIFWL